MMDTLVLHENVSFWPSGFRCTGDWRHAVVRLASRRHLIAHGRAHDSAANAEDV